MLIPAKFKFNPEFLIFGSSGQTTSTYLGWRPGREEGPQKGARGEVVYGPLRGEAGGLYLP